MNYRYVYILSDGYCMGCFTDFENALKSMQYELQIQKQKMGVLYREHDSSYVSAGKEILCVVRKPVATLTIDWENLV